MLPGETRTQRDRRAPDGHQLPGAWNLGEVLPVPAERVRRAALVVTERLTSGGASAYEVALCLSALGIGAAEVDRGMFYAPSEGAS